MSVFFDTDICIAILRGKEPELESKLAGLSLADVCISSIVSAELWVGVEKSAHPVQAEKKLRVFLSHFSTVAFDDFAARKYGEIRASLESKGKAIGGNDFLIAASVLAHDACLITRNRREYERVPGLRLEVW